MALKRTPFILTKFNNLRFFKALSSLLFLFLIFSLSFSPVEGISKQSLYFPSKGDAWEKRKPEDLGMDSKLLQEAVEFARKNPSKDPRDLKKAIERSFSREPFFSILGPTKERGETNGKIGRAHV